MASLSLRVPGHPANDNERRKWHWGRRSKEDGEWTAVTVAIARTSIPSKVKATFPWKRVDIRLVYIKPTRARRDPDNAAGGAKPIIDGLVEAGIIPDDSDEFVRDVCSRVEYEKGVREVRVMVTEVVP